MEKMNEMPKKYESPFQESDIKFPLYGLSKEQLGPENLKSLLNGRKTDALLLKVKNKATSVVKECVARISMTVVEGEKRPWLDFKKESLVIPGILSGVLITEQDKEALQAGKAIYKEGFLKEGKPAFDSWIMVDKSLNQIAFVKDSKIKAPKQLKDIELTAEQQLKWRNGEQIFLTGMTKANTDKKMSAFITHNPITGSVNWQFPNAKGNLKIEKEEVSLTEVKTNANNESPSETKTMKIQTESITENKIATLKIVSDNGGSNTDQSEKQETEKTKSTRSKKVKL